MTSPPRRVLVVQADLPERALSTLADAAHDFRVISRRELDSEPRWLDQAEIAFVQNTDPAPLARAPKLRWVQTYGAGVDWLLSPALRARTELTITNASGVHAQPIAEHVFGLLLALTRNLHRSFAQQPSELWNSAPVREGLSTLEDKTLGILGAGAIGQRLAAVGRALGMRVIGLRRTLGPLAGFDQLFDESGLDALLSQTDYLVNALPLTPRTTGLIGARELARLPRGAVVVNIGRGATFDTEALTEALRSGQLGGAGLDVTEPEPLPPGHPLWRLERVLITPHYAGAHPGYVRRVTEIFLDNLARYRSGEPLVNQVDPEAGY